MTTVLNTGILFECYTRVTIICAMHCLFNCRVNLTRRFYVCLQVEESQYHTLDPQNDRLYLYINNCYCYRLLHNISMFQKLVFIFVFNDSFQNHATVSFLNFSQTFVAEIPYHIAVGNSKLMLCTFLASSIQTYRGIIETEIEGNALYNCMM